MVIKLVKRDPKWLLMVTVDLERPGSGFGNNFQHLHKGGGGREYTHTTSTPFTPTETVLTDQQNTVGHLKVCYTIY